MHDEKEGGSREDETDKRTEYRIARKELRIAIRKAKGEAWNQLVESVDKDP